MIKSMPQAPEPPRARLLTVAEVAELTSMSIAFWRREVRLKQIAVTRLNRAVRISEADLDAYLARRRAGKRR